MKLVRWNPNQDLTSFENEVNHMLRGLWSGAPAARTDGFMPSIDVSETKDSYVVSAELPGMSQGDVKVSVIDNALIIKGEKKSEAEGSEKKEDGAYAHRVERRYGKFERILQLATRVDRNRIAATMKDGVLSISIPKTEEAREREISVEVK